MFGETKMKNYARREAATRSVLLLASVLLLCNALPGRSAPLWRDGPFYLTVELRDHINSDFTACFAVRVNEPFKFTWVHRGDKNTVSGVLRRPEGNEYPLEITVLEAERAGKIGLKGSSRRRLKLDELSGWGELASIAYMRYVTLSEGACK
jgi:hypothetical protein